MFPTMVAALLTLPAGDVQVVPADVTLSGPKATQRLLVLEAKDGAVRGDVTRQAKFASSDPKVADVDDAGQVRAVGNGEATITVTQGDAKAAARVKVERTQDADEP